MRGSSVEVTGWRIRSAGVEGAVEVGRGTDWRVGGAGGRVVWYTLTMLTLGAHIHPAPDTRWQVQMQVPPSPLPFGAGVGWVLGRTCLH